MCCRWTTDFQKPLPGMAAEVRRRSTGEGSRVWASRAWWFGTGYDLLADGCFTGEGALWRRRVVTTVHILDAQEFARLGLGTGGEGVEDSDGSPSPGSLIEDSIVGE